MPLVVNKHVTERRRYRLWPHEGGKVSKGQFGGTRAGRIRNSRFSYPTIQLNTVMRRRPKRKNMNFYILRNHRNNILFSWEEHVSRAYFVSLLDFCLEVRCIIRCRNRYWWALAIGSIIHIPWREEVFKRNTPRHCKETKKDFRVGVVWQRVQPLLSGDSVARQIGQTPASMPSSPVEGFYFPIASLSQATGRDSSLWFTIPSYPQCHKTTLLFATRGPKKMKRCGVGSWTDP
jgi:hypothetical protein